MTCQCRDSFLRTAGLSYTQITFITKCLRYMRLGSMISVLSETPWLGGYLFKESEFRMPNMSNVLCKSCIFSSSRVDQMRSCSFTSRSWITQIWMCRKPTPCPDVTWETVKPALLWDWPRVLSVNVSSRGEPPSYCAAPHTSRVTSNCSFSVCKASSYTVFALCLKTILWGHCHYPQFMESCDRAWVVCL